MSPFTVGFWKKPPNPVEEQIVQNSLLLATANRHSLETAN
jgi:hypothetical protein